MDYHAPVSTKISKSRNVVYKSINLNYITMFSIHSIISIDILTIKKGFSFCQNLNYYFQYSIE